MTTNDAGIRLNLARSTIIDYCRLGIIAAVKPGRDWWIEPAEVERYGRERRPRGRPPNQDSDSAEITPTPTK